MEESNKCIDSDTVEDIPQIPIKTYHWEDVRRSRKKGGYPWTHLTKPPFDEEIDAEMYTMDAYRRSRSSSTLEKSSSHDPLENPETKDVQQEISHEECTTVDANIQALKESDEYEGKIAESRESIKEDDLLSPPVQNVRAQSAEPSKKRKLSVDSSHSRISLSKLAIKDRLRSAKDKLKIPNLIKRSHSDAQESRKPKIQKKLDVVKRVNPGTSKPVYIHIPLKLPPGETDEYSKYEFDSRPPSRTASLTHLTHFGSGKRKLSLLGLLTELKRLYDDQALANESKQDVTTDSDDVAPKDLPIDDSVSGKSIPDESGSGEAINKRQRFKKSSNKSAQELKEMLAASPETSDISQYLDKDDNYEIITTEVPNLDIDCVIITDYDEPSTTHQTLNESPEGSRFNLDTHVPPRIRAKSEEPKRKRKSSIDSSYSRKSLSKLAFMKKIKSAKDSIKLPKFLSFSKLDNKVSNEAPKPQEPKKLEQKRHHEFSTPLYIHIPLKLAEGEVDKYSHYADVDTQVKQENRTDKPAVKDVPECETPISPVVSESGVQLIFLTPPSDDEVLDSTIPETPSESDQKFFESLKVDELKCIAKKAVDTIYPNMKKLEPVVEDAKNEEASQGVGTEGGTTYWQMHPVLVDVEDGLKLSDAAIAMINEEMAKELSANQEEPKSQLKKKVSFKKSRAQDGERIYEDVGLPPEIAKENPPPLEASRSMSADEEKSYLDENVIVKNTSLDDDYNKWSKITDHEYELVNPPEDMKIPEVNIETNLTRPHTNEQAKHISFNENVPPETIPEKLADLSAQHFQEQMEDRYFNPSKISQTKPVDSPKEMRKDDRKQPNKLEDKKKDALPQRRSTGNAFNQAIKTQADKIKSKLQSIKKPHINLPQAPKFSTATLTKLKFKKPTFKAPKMPEIPPVKLASLSFKRKDSKNSWRKRQYSTESNAGDSKTKMFGFRTYPRIFEKSKVLKQSSLDGSFAKTTPPVPTFATVPRARRTKRLEDAELEYEQNQNEKKEEEPKEYYYDKTRGIVTIPIDVDTDAALQLPSHIGYNQDINIDDGLNGGEEELPEIPLQINSLIAEWEEDTNKNYLNRQNNNNNNNRDAGYIQSDQSSPVLSEHRQGVIEEIDSDQFFLREKGISQDDLEVGNYLSSEIKEAFRNPINSLAQMQSEDREYDVDITDQSQSSEELPKRKWLKKPKRKKTPHVSKEELSFEFGSDPEEYVGNKIEYIVQAPTKPKRRSKKKKKLDPEVVVPYQETIPFEEPHIEPFEFIDDNEYPHEPLPDIFKDDENFNIQVEPPVYMNTKEAQLESSPTYVNTCEDVTIIFSPPIRPERKNKSIKSINTLEAYASLDNQNDSVEEFINVFVPDSSVAEKTEKSPPPCRPERKRSHTRSESVSSLREQKAPSYDTPPVRPIRLRSRTRSVSIPSSMQDIDLTIIDMPPVRPGRIRSRTRSQSTESLPGSRLLESPLDVSIEIPCVEETCIQVICDRMGYAVVDKTKIRDPPLPPSRFPKTPPRRRRRKQPPTENGKFATVPRPPQRPLRNYSTLSRPSVVSTSNGILFDDDKENLDVNPYIEIEEDELARRLQSGEVIQKMRERPLPAPPRPPRKSRSPNREVFRDISHERNLPSSNNTLGSKYSDISDLTEAQLFEMEQQILTDDHEETITHAALVVQPIGRSTAISYNEAFNERRDPSMSPPVERIILVEREVLEKSSEHEFVEEDNIPDDVDSDDEGPSEIPEEFYKYKQPETEIEEKAPNIKLQLLDIDKLRVNELTANKIIVSDLEGVNLRVSELNSKSGNLVISGIELPQQEVLDRLQSQQDHEDTPEQREEQCPPDQEEEQDALELGDENEPEPPPIPPRSDSVGDLFDATLPESEDLIEEVQQPHLEFVIAEPPTRPPRRSSQPERPNKEFDLVETELVEEDGLLLETKAITQPLHVDQSFSELRELETDSTKETKTNGSIDQSSTAEAVSKIAQSRELEPDTTESMPENCHDCDTQTSQPEQDEQYVPSQPPLSFYRLVSPALNFDENIPLAQCRRCRKLSTLSRSSSLEELSPRQQRSRRLSVPSIPELTGQLVQSCAAEMDRWFRNLVNYVSSNVENKQDVQLLLLMLVILVGSLILMGDDHKVHHHHHWEYFNPPKEF